MRNVCKLAVVLASAMTIAAPPVQATWLSVRAPVQVAPGWTRIAGRYASDSRSPVFRAIARCEGIDVHVLDPHVHLAPEQGALWLDLPGTPERLVPSATPCETPELSVEMLVDATVMASAPVPSPPLANRPRRFSLTGHKYGLPFSKRTEAGVAWSLDSRVSIQLNYERTQQAPMMSFDHDNGILTRLRVGF